MPGNQGNRSEVLVVPEAAHHATPELSVPAADTLFCCSHLKPLLGILATQSPIEGQGPPFAGHFKTMADLAALL